MMIPSLRRGCSGQLSDDDVGAWWGCVNISYSGTCCVWYVRLCEILMHGNSMGTVPW